MEDDSCDCRECSSISHSLLPEGVVRFLVLRFPYLGMGGTNRLTTVAGVGMALRLAVAFVPFSVLFLSGNIPCNGGSSVVPGSVALESPLLPVAPVLANAAIECLLPAVDLSISRHTVPGLERAVRHDCVVDCGGVKRHHAAGIIILTLDLPVIDVMDESAAEGLSGRGLVGSKRSIKVTGSGSIIVD